MISAKNGELMENALHVSVSLKKQSTEFVSRLTQPALIPNTLTPKEIVFKTISIAKFSKNGVENAPDVSGDIN